MSISWDPVIGADEYVVEESDTAGFLKCREVYRGPATFYNPTAASDNTIYFKRTFHSLMDPAFALSIRWYRVKAVSSLFGDSPWSKVVSV